MPPLADLRLRLSEDGALHAAGDLDLTTKAAFVHALAARLDAPRPPGVPHLDLTALAFLDSAGLESLVWAHRRLAAKGAVLHMRVRQPSQPARVLRIGLFQRLFRLDFVASDFVASDFVASDFVASDFVASDFVDQGKEPSL